MELGSDEAEGNVFARPHRAWTMQRIARTPVAEKTRLKCWIGVGFGGSLSIDLYLGTGNVYLLIAEEMGLVGLGSFLLVMGVFFAYAWRAWRRMQRDSDLEPILYSLAWREPCWERGLGDWSITIPSSLISAHGLPLLALRRLDRGYDQDCGTSQGPSWRFAEPR